MISRSKRQARRLGFTLIEILAVLMVLGVVGVMVLARIQSPADVVAEADTFRSHLGFVQGQAMANNTRVWSLFIRSGSYQLLRDGQPFSLPAETNNTHVLARGVVMSPNNFSLTFDRWGAPTHGGLTFNFTQGGRLQTVSITRFTGLVP